MLVGMVLAVVIISTHDIYRWLKTEMVLEPLEDNLVTWRQARAGHYYAIYPARASRGFRWARDGDSKGNPFIISGLEG